MKGGQYGAFGATTLEKSKLDLTQKQTKSSPELQFFISGLEGDEIIQNRVLESMYRRIIQAHHEKKSFRVIIVIPLLSGHPIIVDFSPVTDFREATCRQYEENVVDLVRRAMPLALLPNDDPRLDELKKMQEKKYELDIMAHKKVRLISQQQLL